MREVLACARAGGETVRLALEVYVHRLRAGIGAMVAALGGVDGLVFTGGVGERAAEVRARALEGLRFLGLEIDDRRNEHAVADADLSPGEARVMTLVVRAREDLEIARQVRGILERRAEADKLNADLEEAGATVELKRCGCGAHLARRSR